MDVEKDERGRVSRRPGAWSTRLELACSRCLEPFELPVDAPFDLRYLPQRRERRRSDEREIDEDDLTTAFYRDGSLDLGRAAARAVLAGAADEAAVQRRVPGAVPGVRRRT